MPLGVTAVPVGSGVTVGPVGSAGIEPVGATSVGVVAGLFDVFSSPQAERAADKSTDSATRDGEMLRREAGTTADADRRAGVTGVFGQVRVRQFI